MFINDLILSFLEVTCTLRFYKLWSYNKPECPVSEENLTTYPFMYLQEMIEQYVHWNEDIGEWQLKCVAYTGNNMRKQTPAPDKDKDKVKDSPLQHCK